jgi:hypothetical protein
MGLLVSPYLLHYFIANSLLQVNNITVWLFGTKISIDKYRTLTYTLCQLYSH